ncbi:MAG: choice-of-anchor J domain-containing protein [Bacteroidales bacterium]|nr:choice-of-anchor J domain-containing protein [Bacteroidales bacterium]
MKKATILIFLALMAFAPMTWAQDQTLTLNDGTNLRDEVPIRGLMDREGLGSQFIIPASELTAMQGGTINQLTFYAETASYSFSGAEYKVYITEVDYTEFEPEVFHSLFDIESASYCDWNTMADYYSGGVSISNNMMVITLTAPYHYTGGNLLIGIRLTEKGSNGDNINWYGMNQSTVSSVYPLYLGSNEFYFSAKYLPKVTFGYTPSSSASTCMWPIVTSATVTNHTATIHWTENSEATAWQVCLNDDESNILDASTNSYTFYGLDTLSTYTAKVRSVCGGESHSDWSNKVVFTTTEACAPPTNLTAIDLTPPHATVTWDSYGENFRLQVSAIGGGNSKDWPSDTHDYGFEENTISPWTQIDADGDGKMWEINSNPTSYGPYIANAKGHTGDKMVISGGADGIGRTFWPDNYLVSPRIMLGGSISFWARQYYKDGVEAFKVMVSTTGNTSASDFTPIANSNYVLDNTQWNYYTVSLSAYDGQMGYVAFYDYDHGIHDALLLIDDITIVEGSNYIDCATNSYTMDVEPNTEYVMRVRTSCGIDDGFSEWSDFYSFTTTDVVPVYEINSEEDWNAFAYAVNHGYDYSGETVSLNTDLNGITTMVGAKTVDNSYKYFKGTFNGNGHTLTVNYTDNSSDHYCGPFRFINGATIQNLHVDGTIIKADKKHAGGFVGQAFGTNNIINCRSTVDIQSHTDGDGSHGGFFGDLRDGTTNFKNCVFDGKLQGANTKKWGGFVGWVADGKKAKFTNCLFAPTLVDVNNDGNRTFARRDDGDDLTFTNSYYTQTLGSAQGKKACTISANEHVTMTPYGTEEAGISGGITAYSLGSSVYNPCIMVNGTLYSGSGNNVQLNLVLNGNPVTNYESDKFIATPGTLNGTASPFTLVMPNTNTVVSLAPSDWNTHAGTADDPYPFYNAEQWNLLAHRVNNENQTYSGKFFKLMADITVTETVSSDTPMTMVGTSDSKSFQGTFDGNGHTITLNYNDTRDADFCAPFRYINGATIKYLHVDGTIYKTQGKNAGGLVGKAVGNNTISNCRSSVDIHFNKDGDVSSGGFIGELRESGSTTLNNCLFDGKLQGTNNDCWGGFVGWVASGRTAIFNNCLFKPTEVPNNYTDSDNKTFARKDGNVNVNNCYYTQLLGNDAQDATNATGYENEALRFGLGHGWEIVTEMEIDGTETLNVEKVVPIMKKHSLSGDGTLASPYLINSADDWNGLASNVFLGETYSGQYLQLTNHITVNRMIGTGTNDPTHNTYSFSGTFNGDGNTLTFDYSTNVGTEGLVAPFRFVDGATIQNLVVDGTIVAANKYAAGIIARVDGNTTLSNCRSSIIINSSVSGVGGHGGLVGLVRTGSVLTIDGCLFDGKLLGSGTTHCGGLVGEAFKDENSSSTVNITNSLCAPAELTVGTTGSSALVGISNGNTNITATNSYYTQTLGTEQGKQARTITAGSNVTVENAGTATEYDVSGITTYGVGIKYNDKLYAGNEDAVSLNLGYTAIGYNVTSYNASNDGTITGSSNPYTLNMPNANVTITATTTAAEWDGDGDSWETAYLIYNKDQFKLLASCVNNGTSTYANKYFKLMTDFTISITGTSNIANTMANNLVGVSTTNTFNGHFDGNGHTITLNLTTSDRDNHYMAPFRYTNGAEIKNLRIAGTSSSDEKETGGIIGHAQGNNRISGCHVNANFTLYPNQSSANQQYPNLECTTLHGTFISYVAGGDNIIEGCLFDGSITVRQSYVTSITCYNDYSAGFVGGSALGSTVTVKGCVFNPTSVDNRFRNAKTFVAGDATVNVINSYYIDYPLAEVQGKRMRNFAPDEHVTITASTPTVHSVSGITTYNDCIFWDNAFRAGEADEVNLTLSNDQGYYGYDVTAGSIARNGANWTLTMPDEDVTISAIYDWAGSGTEGNPFIISCTADLDLLATRVNNGTSTYTGKYFRLANDIVYTGNESNYTPIGCMIANPDNPEMPIQRYFDGNFDGQGFTISGIRINDTDGMCKGLFGYNYSNAVVRDVTLSDSEITGSMMVGGIAGYNLGGTITNCHVTNTVVLHGTNGNTMGFGGIVGTNGQTTSEISYCTSSASFTVTEEEGYISREFGGIVGANIGTLSHNLVIGTTIPTCGFSSHGAIAGGSGNNLSNNYYVNCTVAGVANATGVGIGSKEPSNVGDPYETYDVTDNDGAVPGNVRTIAAPTDWNSENPDGWTFIASPFTANTDPNSSSVENIFNASEYDLYRLNPSNSMWENYKQDGDHYHFSLENGRGYLYATQVGTTVKFIGENTSAYNVNDIAYVILGAGFNLVGNPFPRAAYVNKSYYKLNTDGSAVVADPVSSTTYISPCNGVIIQSTADEVVTFSTTAPSPADAAPNNGNLNIALAQTTVTRSGTDSKTIDNAIVSFNEGNELGKFYFGTQNANLYIPQDGEEYAIVSAKAQGEMPVCFKANQDGEYTITINAEEVEMDYLHLIDNMTGADVDLLANPSYTFSANTTDYASRFRLVFAANKANLGDEGNDNFAFISNGQLMVTGEGLLQIFDVLGHQLYAKQVSSLTSNLSPLTSPGVYVLRLIDGENVKTQKIVIK